MGGARVGLRDGATRCPNGPFHRHDPSDFHACRPMRGRWGCVVDAAPCRRGGSGREASWGFHGADLRPRAGLRCDAAGPDGGAGLSALAHRRGDAVAPAPRDGGHPRRRGRRLPRALGRAGSARRGQREGRREGRRKGRRERRREDPCGGSECVFAAPARRGRGAAREMHDRPDRRGAARRTPRHRRRRPAPDPRVRDLSRLALPRAARRAQGRRAEGGEARLLQALQGVPPRPLLPQGDRPPRGPPRR